MMIMRELTGGLYFGKRSTQEENGVLTAKDELTYNEEEIRRIARRGFDIARKRRKKVTSVDKANVLDSSRLWRKIVEEVAASYPDVTLEHMLVDNCAMQLVKDPAQFDVILTENMFGDILSDEASMVTGSIGMLASASLKMCIRDRSKHRYEVLSKKMTELGCIIGGIIEAVKNGNWK